MSASSDSTLKVWDMKTGRTLRTLKGHADGVLDVALTSDGKRAVSASLDNTVKVWNLETGVPMATFYCDGAAQCCAVLDNRLIVAGDAGRVYFLEFV